MSGTELRPYCSRTRFPTQPAIRHTDAIEIVPATGGKRGDKAQLAIAMMATNVPTTTPMPLSRNSSNTKHPPPRILRLFALEIHRQGSNAAVRVGRAYDGRSHGITEAQGVRSWRARVGGDGHETHAARGPAP